LVAAKHTLVVLDPGHFHAALTLREHHPRLSDEVHVYAEDGPDLERFLGVVQAFNQRSDAPTHWKLRVYRGSDCLERLCLERRGDIVVVATRNDTKMTSIHRLHGAGLFVLGDKPWLIDPRQLPMLEKVATTAPLATDIMTERHDVANRVLKALIEHPAFFGRFRDDGGDPAICIRSVHHLLKTVNGQALVRPPWYFDIAVQGEGITDVTTHLVDLAQWMVGATGFDYARDVELLAARQWSTDVPREAFAQITGLREFPESLRARTKGEVLRLLCNASIDFRLRGVPVRIESIWELAAPKGAGDMNYVAVRGTGANLVIEQNERTGFLPELSASPVSDKGKGALADRVASLQSRFHGLGIRPSDGALHITIPGTLRTTHEQHFARVLDRFLDEIDGGKPPAGAAADLVTRYTLLARAAELSHTSA
jgi:predicted dehydrogenase